MRKPLQHALILTTALILSACGSGVKKTVLPKDAIRSPMLTELLMKLDSEDQKLLLAYVTRSSVSPSTITTGTRQVTVEEAITAERQYEQNTLRFEAENKASHITISDYISVRLLETSLVSTTAGDTLVLRYRANSTSGKTIRQFVGKATFYDGNGNALATVDATDKADIPPHLQLEFTNNYPLAGTDEQLQHLAHAPYRQLSMKFEPTKLVFGDGLEITNEPPPAQKPN